MLKKANLLYYSTSTAIAFQINTMFYGGKHYLWCSPVFEPSSLDKRDPRAKIPASSSPNIIYQRYLSDVAGGDRHSALIAQNKAGILRGASFMLQQEVITGQEFAMINAMVNQASVSDFKPLLYLIPGTNVSLRMNLVPVEEAANPLGIEYRIQDLMEGEFDVIELR